MATGDPAAWQRAVDFAERLTEIDPQGNISFKRLGDTLYASGDRAKAAAAYRQALAADDQLELDPLVQFSKEERREMEARVGAGSGGS